MLLISFESIPTWSVTSVHQYHKEAFFFPGRYHLLSQSVSCCLSAFMLHVHEFGPCAPPAIGLSRAASAGNSPRCCHLLLGVICSITFSSHDVSRDGYGGAVFSCWCCFIHGSFIEDQLGDCVAMPKIKQPIVVDGMNPFSRLKNPCY